MCAALLPHDCILSSGEETENYREGATPIIVHILFGFLHIAAIIDRCFFRREQTCLVGKRIASRAV
jgi:hypothetical protein